MSDSSGAISYRAWLYSTNEKGEPIGAVEADQVGYTIMPVNPTPQHALSHPAAQDTREEEAMEAVVSTLNEAERRVAEVLDEYQPHRGWCRKLKSGDCTCGTWPHRDGCAARPCDCGAEAIIERTILAGDLQRHQRYGYLLVPGSEVEIVREGRPTVRQLRVVGIERATLTFAQAAERLGIDEAEVVRLFRSGRRKWRGRGKR